MNDLKHFLNTKQMQELNTKSRKVLLKHCKHIAVTIETMKCAIV